MAKAKKGLIISLLTLIIAIVVTTTSTYAWFAMNTEVTATNMQVTAKSDTTYLVICKDEELSSSKMPNNAQREISLLPVSPAVPTAVLPTKVKLDNSDAVVLTDGVPTWQKGVGTSFTNGAANGDLQDIAAGDVGNFVAHFEFNVGLNPAVSQFNATNLKLSKLNVSKVTGDASGIFFAPLSVLVVADYGTGYNCDSYVNAGESSATAAGDNVAVGDVTVHNTVLASTVNKDGTPIKIHVYLYINGEHTNVTTANAVAANLGTYTCSLGFTVTPGTAA